MSVTTTNSPTSAQTSQQGNIASLVDPNTLSNLNNANSPQTFGDQLKNKAKSTVVKGLVQSTLSRLYLEKTALIQAGIKADIDHQIALQKIEVQHTPKKQVQNGQTIDIPAEINDEEYQQAINNENKNYEDSKKILQIQKEQNQKAIDDYLKDPFKKQKEERKKRQRARSQKQKRNREEKTKARKARMQAILKNAKKSLAPILALTLTNKVVEIVSQNSKIKKLVDDTNAIIIEANESGNASKLNRAQVARNNAIRIIQSNESKITQIRNQINTISTYINIFSIIISIISAIPIPTAVPPGIGIPVSLIIKLVKVLDKANRVLLVLSALIPVLIACLERAISILRDLRDQLLNINGVLENIAISGIPGTEILLNNSSDGGIGNGSDLNSGTYSGDGFFPTEYKGFKFALKEEERPKVAIRGGYKRRYAVAIDINRVEVLKSDLSYTLDPNDLIDQLKIIIDRLGLNGNNTVSDPNNPNKSTNTPIKGIDTGNTNTSLTNSSIISTNKSNQSLISSLTVLTSRPPQPKLIVAPGGIVAQIPLGVIAKARLIAIAAASGPNPLPKIGVAFVFAADKKWQADYKRYQNRNQGIVDSTSSSS